jgi:hypothetical protein
MNKFTPGQKVFCIKVPGPSYAGEEGNFYGDCLNTRSIYTIWGFNEKDNIVTIREIWGTLSADRFVDAERYLHKKDYENKLEGMMDD